MIAQQIAKANPTTMEIKCNSTKKQKKKSEKVSVSISLSIK